MSEPATQFEIALATTAAAEPIPYDDERRRDEETIMRHYEFLLGIGDALDIGRFVIATGLKIECANAPKNMQEAAAKMKVSRSRAYQIYGKIGQRTP